MNVRAVLHDPLFKRMFQLFLIFEFVPTLLVVAVPLVYWLGRAEGDAPQTLFVLALVEFIFPMLLSVLLAWYVAMPLFSLMKGIRAVGAGDLSYRAAVRPGKDELVSLIDTFNTMVQNIETMHNRLDEQRALLQDSLAVREREFDVILEIANLVNSPVDLTSKLDHALKIARPVLGSDIIALALLDESDTLGSIVYACRECEHHRKCEQCDCDLCEQQHLIRQCVRLLQDSSIREAVQTQAIVRLFNTPDDALDPALRGVLDQLGMPKLAIKPLIAHGRVLGVLVLMRHHIITVPTRSTTLLDTLSENVAVLIENWHLQTKVRELTVMQERRRMASDLHDSVTQSLFTLSLTAGGLRTTLQEVPGVDRQALDMLVQQTRVIQGEMRTLINELRPVDLETNDLNAALRQHIESLRYSAHIDTNLHIYGSLRRVPMPIQQQLNRIAQEALSNVARHSQAVQAWLVLEVGETVVTLTVIDDGQGFNMPGVVVDSSESLGLTSMRERAEMLGGTLIVRSTPGEGTSITVHIPLATIEVETVYA